MKEVGCSKKGIQGVQVDVLSVFGNVFGNWSEAQTAELIYVLSYKEYAKKEGALKMEYRVGLNCMINQMRYFYIKEAGFKNQQELRISLR